jgi:hypothetical protein
MALPQIFNQIAVALKIRDIKTAEKLLKSAANMFPAHPYVSFQKAMLEDLKGSDKREVVAPLYLAALQKLQDDFDYLYNFG